MKQLKVIDFNLKETLESGQFFLFKLIDDFYYIIHSDNIFKVKQENEILFFEGINEKDLIYFFSLDVDYSKIYEEFDDEYLLNALEKYRGLRIIRQDLWQCLVSFVCSSCSNIPKITKNLELISKFFGEKVIFDGMKFYTFPKLGNLCSYDSLKEAKTGYRADYLFKINEMLTQDYLKKIENGSYEDAKKLLMELPGIGSKVADCICLFSLGHLDAFPVDTWVKQIVEKYYFKRSAKNIKDTRNQKISGQFKSNLNRIEKFGREYFGEFAGIKQQYLFHYFRNLK